MILKTELRTLAIGALASMMSVLALPATVQAQEAEARPPLAAAVPAGAPMSFADLIEEVSPAVVSIEAAGTVEPENQPDLSQLPPIS